MSVEPQPFETDAPRKRTRIQGAPIATSSKTEALQDIREELSRIADALEALVETKNND